MRRCLRVYPGQRVELHRRNACRFLRETSPANASPLPVFGRRSQAQLSDHWLGSPRIETVGSFPALTDGRASDASGQVVFAGLANDIAVLLAVSVEADFRARPL